VSRSRVARNNRSYGRVELTEVADGLARLLDAIGRGELTAGPGTVTRLEGAMIALRSLAEGRSVAPEDFEGDEASA
jgi:hypothetical protein